MDTVTLRWLFSGLFSLLNNGAAFFFLGAFLTRTLRPLPFAALWAADTLMLSFANGAGLGPVLTGALFIGTKLIFCFLLYEGRRVYQWVLPLVLPFLFLGANCVSAALLWLVWMRGPLWMQDPYFLTQTLFIAKLLLLTALFLLRRLIRLRRLGKIPPAALLAPLVFPLSGALVLVLCARMSLYLPMARRRELLAIALAVGLADVTLIFLLDWMEKSARQKTRLQLLEQQQKLQLESIEALRDSYGALRKNAHDYNRHLTLLAQLLAEDKPEQARDYLDQILDAQTRRVLAVNSHHPIVDAVFNQHYYAAQKAGIEMEFAVNDLSALKVSAEDLVVLLSNLLDNAQEACHKVRTPKIQVQLTRNQNTGEVFLSVRNTSPFVRLAKGQLPATDKPDPLLHGCGLANVQTVLKNLDAESAFDWSDGWFQFTAAFFEA